MKKLLLFLLLISSVRSSTFAADCDCTITPYKPDPPCFVTCVSKALANASYSQLTGKYGLSEDVAKRIIQAREKGADTSPGWYRKILTNSDVSHVDAKFNDAIHRRDSTIDTTTATTTTPK